MDIYTIYLTEEIAKKALEKGCPLQRVYEQYAGQPPIYYTLPYNHPDWFQCDAYYIPTAEQICGWLLNEKNIDIDIHRVQDYEFEIEIYVQNRIVFQVFHNLVSGPKKEALLEGINEALELI